jgi:hypothetical protein
MQYGPSIEPMPYAAPIIPVEVALDNLLFLFKLDLMCFLSDRFELAVLWQGTEVLIETYVVVVWLHCFGLI